MLRDAIRLSKRLHGVISNGSVRHSWLMHGEEVLSPVAVANSLEYGQWTRRLLSTIDSEQHEIDDINAAFVLAREEIEYAQEDAESTYFNESYQTAKSAVDKVLGDFSAVLQRLDPPEREKLQRSMGLKMEQLKAELEQLDRLHT